MYNNIEKNIQFLSPLTLWILEIHDWNYGYDNIYLDLGREFRAPYSGDEVIAGVSDILATGEVLPADEDRYAIFMHDNDKKYYDIIFSGDVSPRKSCLCQYPKQLSLISLP